VDELLVLHPLSWTVRARAGVDPARAGEAVSWRARWCGLTSLHSYNSFIGALGGTMAEGRKKITGWTLLLLRSFFLPRGLSGRSGRRLTELTLKAGGTSRGDYGVPTIGRLRCWMTDMPSS
jgi:hypothetical protein